MLMYYVNCYSFLENPERDWAKWFKKQRKSLLRRACLSRGLTFGKEKPEVLFMRAPG